MLSLNKIIIENSTKTKKTSHHPSLAVLTSPLVVRIMEEDPGGGIALFGDGPITEVAR